MDDAYPQRIVCLTEETTETLYLLGEAARIVGISAFTERPPEARLEKPVVAGFTTADVDQIMDLRPELVLGFSDLQAEIARELIRRGVAVHIFNHRTVAGILGMVLQLGGLVGATDRAAELVAELQLSLSRTRENGHRFPYKPKVFFEEWNDPLISGIGWISELIEIAGGVDCFAELSARSLAANRVIADSGEVIRRAPDIIIGSWCGKHFQPDIVAARPGWHQIPAVRERQLFEMDPSIILQPGPAALTSGVSAIQKILTAWQGPAR